MNSEVDLTGMFPKAGTDETLQPSDFGPITQDLIRYLESEAGGGMSHRDATSVLAVAREFLSTVNIRDGQIASTTNCALIGRVQSGKTTGLAVTIAALADVGVSCFVVMTGTKTNLTEQTAEELKEKFESLRRGRPWRWRFVSASQDRTVLQETINEVVNPRNQIDQTRQLLVVTCIKEDDRLTNLKSVLSNISTSNPNIVDRRFAIFDDEGDQASANNSPRNTQQASTINRLLKDLRNSVGTHLFVPVTATPQALLVQERDNSLRPESCVLLPPGTEYVGGEVLFVDRHKEFVRTIPDDDVIALQREDVYPPPSLQEALATFLLTVALIRSGRRKPIPVSMLIHPHQQNAPHVHVVAWVKNILNGWLAQVQGADDLIDEVCYPFFLSAANDLATTAKQRIHDSGFGTSGDGLRHWIFRACEIIGGQDLQVRKLSGPDQFSRTEWRDSDAWIFVGGEMLGRGFVVRGLTTTYMSRDVLAGRPYNADTLQQRARFFGYKRSYSDLLRGWFPDALADKYEKYVEHEEFLWTFLIEQKRANRSLNSVRTIFEMSQHARPTRSAANRTRGRTQHVNRFWVKQEFLYAETLKSNIDHFREWASRHTTSLVKWTPPSFTSSRASFDTYVVGTGGVVELFNGWSALSMDSAMLSAVRRRLKTWSEGDKFRVVDMTSRQPGDEPIAERGPRKTRSPQADVLDPWVTPDFAQINELFSNPRGAEHRLIDDPEAAMTILYYRVRPKPYHGDPAAEVGALAIRFSDPILTYVFYEVE